MMKIKTKMDGLQQFKLRKYQKRFDAFWDDIKGPVRIITLKPRQAGWSTFIAGKFAHKMATTASYKGLAMADKSKRTAEIQSIYSTFIDNLPLEFRPMISKNNTEEILFDNPKKQEKGARPGLGSGLIYETAQDPNAGRSGSRRFAHLSENAFYRYYREIDEGVQNSIPIASGTAIIKESTANGRSGIGKGFYDLWSAAERGESIYKPFFVSWYEIDDYQIQIPRGFIPTKEEREILSQNPNVTQANLSWRRLKLLEYLSDEDNQFLSPAERFKQDFPLTSSEAFRHSGAPVFDPDTVSKMVTFLTSFKPNNIAIIVSKNDHMMTNYMADLKIFAPPRKGKQYFIGADVAEGLAQGDHSSLMIMDSEYNQVGSWHGKVDPDVFGHLMISIGRVYNNAVLIPEKNNMGHTTVTTIRNEGYYPLYTKVKEDKITTERVTEYGWRTTQKSKQEMLNEAIARTRDEDCKILDIGLVREMEIIARGDNGDVDLNGRDRVVAFCLTLIGIKHYRTATVVRTSENTAKGTGVELQTGGYIHGKNKSGDMFD